VRLVFLHRLAALAGYIGLTAAFTLILHSAASSAYDAFRQAATASGPRVAPLDLSNVMYAPATITVPVAAGFEFAPWRTSEAELLSNAFLWRRMHLAEWNAVPNRLREQALERMFLRYRATLFAPSVWDTMDAADWDRIPQPMRIVAFKQMVAYWAGYYGVGVEYGLPRRLVADTLAAIVMSESWFDHRAVVVNRYGNRDLGLAQASDYARERMRRLYAAGHVDVELTDDDYFNPWLATRFVAIWMSLLLAETDGHLDAAIAAYHRGSANANDSLGRAYLDIVRQRRTRYIRNHDASDAWDYLWRTARTLQDSLWPWTAANLRMH
jgi:hypothetical protein